VTVTGLTQAYPDPACLRHGGDLLPHQLADDLRGGLVGRILSGTEPDGGEFVYFRHIRLHTPGNKTGFTGANLRRVLRSTWFIFFAACCMMFPCC
jgi:DUF1680 family protein